MFDTRNLYYLKISKETVLPLYLYLDRQHVHWMSDYVLQCVLHDLKPLIGPKIALEGDELLEMGTKNPKATVEVVRGEGYQFAFFFRKMESHEVLIKSRNFKMVPRVPENIIREKNLAESATKRGKKRARTTETDEEQDIQMTDTMTAGKRISGRKVRRLIPEKDSMDQDQDEIVDLDSDQDSTYAPQEDRAQTLNDRIKREVDDISLNTQNIGGFTHPIDVDEEEKPKMTMYLSYGGSHIPGRFLCVIVEPYPPLLPEQIPREATVEPPEIRFQTAPDMPQLQLRDSSRAPSVLPDSIRARSVTPLFLPDDDDYRGRAETPAIDHNQPKSFPPVPLFNQRDQTHEERQDSNDGDLHLLAFSQAMAGVGHEEGGDDSDEDYLKGDADEDVRVIE